MITLKDDNNQIVVDKLLEQIEGIDNSPTANCHKSCDYGDICDKKQCYLLMEMHGEKLPSKAQKVIDNMEEEFNNSLNKSRKLFDKSVEKYGIPLWKNEAWQNNHCEKLCPFGQECDKKLFTIKGYKMCYGQIYIGYPIKIAKKKKDKILNNFYYMIGDFGQIKNDKGGLLGDNVLEESYVKETLKNFPK